MSLDLGHPNNQAKAEKVCASEQGAGSSTQEQVSELSPEDRWEVGRWSERSRAAGHRGCETAPWLKDGSSASAHGRARASSCGRGIWADSVVMSWVRMGGQKGGRGCGMWNSKLNSYM